MIKTTVSTLINCPLKQVYDFLMDLDNYPMWQNGLAKVRASNGMEVGSIIEFTQVGLGQSFNLSAQVIANDGHASFQVIREQGPITFSAIYTLTEQKNATKLEIINEIETSRLFKLAEPVLQTISDNRYRADIAGLKATLESQAPSSA